MVPDFVSANLPVNGFSHYRSGSLRLIPQFDSGGLDNLMTAVIPGQCIEFKKIDTFRPEKSAYRRYFKLRNLRCINAEG